MCGGCEDCAAVDTSKPKIAWEYHATVLSEWEQFKTFCDANNVKAIRIENIHQNDDINTYSFMTSHKIIGDVFDECIVEYLRVYSLINDNFKVVRNKLEVAPWVDSVPKYHWDFIDLCRDPEVDFDPGYFEVHFQINGDTSKVRQKLWKHNLHLSRNIDKPNILMATYRRVSWLERFEREVNDLKKKLRTLPVDKRVIIEYTSYDSNKEYDSKWLASG